MSTTPTIDLNSDIGESFGRWTLGDDAQILRAVSSGSIACGFHAGDPSHMLATLRAARESRTTIGAHVAYRDLAGFGRRFLDVDPAELMADVLYQLSALDGMARTLGLRVAYVKPHGALYHAMDHHPGQASAVLDALEAYDPALPLLLLPGSAAAEEARHRGLRVVGEAFADRAYTPDGDLVPRRDPGAVIRDPEAVAARVLRLARTGEIEAIDGTVLRLDVASVCLHGDTPGAVEIARTVRATLDDAGVQVASFA
ncbi:LamB/YcsF family protein [Brachybacterium sp. EF45031]|uniref:LamB/YcsF family protein n=1 Tax=Brachybacterium sillae TaxID=2810536 RepID=UPI00217D5C78|nr:5-oxoprolinase subunit PxpA [Brachybacterium sillae]MCS6712246.1 LamB/YcsF family protein [Brachybacterium sillae]